jgi:hypothetical protein
MLPIAIISFPVRDLSDFFRRSIMLINITFINNL